MASVVCCTLPTLTHLQRERDTAYFCNAMGECVAVCVYVRVCAQVCNDAKITFQLENGGETRQVPAARLRLCFRVVL